MPLLVMALWLVLGLSPTQRGGGPPVPILVKDACADGRYQIAIEGAYVLMNASTCEFAWQADLCQDTTNWHKLCYPVTSIKHWSRAWGDPGEFCMGGPVTFDTNGAYTYHKNTITQ